MMAKTQPSDQMLEIMIKTLQKSASQSELDELRLWIQKDSESHQYFDDFAHTWHIARMKETDSRYDSYNAWNKLKKIAAIRSNDKGISSSGKLLSFGWFKVAALVVLTFGVGYFVSNVLHHTPKPNSEVAYTTYVVPYGSQSEVVLPDGSNVKLNAGSRLKYAIDYNVNHRDVWLDGEAYFDVKANKKLPFHVNTYALSVSVLGTAFNVKAYREENSIETTVERGEIKITGNGNYKLDHDFVIAVKQKAIITVANKKMNSSVLTKSSSLEVAKVTVDRNVPTELSTSWKDKRWIIEREELVTLAVKLERRYDVSIEFTSESLKHFVFSGTIEDETLGQVLKVISLTAPVNYQLDKKHLVLKENKSMGKYFSSPH